MEYVYYCDTTCQWMFNIPYPDRKGCYNEAFKSEFEATDAAKRFVFMKSIPLDITWVSEFMGFDDPIGAPDHPPIGPPDHPAFGAAVGPPDHPPIGPPDHPAFGAPDHPPIGAVVGPPDHPAFGAAVGPPDHPPIGAVVGPPDHHAGGPPDHPAGGLAGGAVIGAPDHPAGGPPVGAPDHPAGGLPDHHAVGAVIGGRKRKSKDFPKSRFQHVFWSKNQGKWNVRVKHPKTQKQMCATFVDEVEAARDADRKLFELYKIDNSLKPKLKFNFFKF